MVFIQRLTYASSSIISLFFLSSASYDLGSISSAFHPTFSSSTISPPSFLLRSSFHFIPLLLPVCETLEQIIVSSDLWERVGGFSRRAWAKINTIIPSVYGIVQFSWIILFSKFQIFSKEEPFSYSLILLRGLIFFANKKEKEARNTLSYEYKSYELDFKFKSVASDKNHGGNATRVETRENERKCMFVRGKI